MSKRFLVIIHDDFELLGNGAGDVAQLQYLPAVALMNMAHERDIRITFMVEVAQQLAFVRHENQQGIRIQRQLWDETVLLMKERRFDVQLHLHPQWINASYRNGHFAVSNVWNLGLYKDVDQQALIRDAIDYLHALIKPRFPEYRVCAFKAGWWGLQPSKTILSELCRVGVKVILGVREGLYIPASNVDYRTLEESLLPYYPDIDDITRISAMQRDVAVVPLTPYIPGVLSLCRLGSHKLLRRYLYRNDGCTARVPTSIGTAFPKKHNFTLSLHPYRTHLKIGNYPFGYLKHSFDRVITQLRRHDAPRIPIVIESHTKLYKSYYKDLQRFMDYILERYESEIEFGTLTEFVDEISANPCLVRSKG